METIVSHLANHDLFRRTALGKNGLRLWAWMCQHPEPFTVKIVVMELDMSAKTLLGKFRKMQRCSMIIRKGNAWTINKSADLLRAAEILGTAGSGQRQRKRHETERRAYNYYYARNKAIPNHFMR